ncbi:MAG: ribonuclease P protein component [Synergistales bacterium]|nr:ribonuclease P protein component [Synergistales bacterium]
MKLKFPRCNRITRSWEYDLVFRTGSRISGQLVRLLFVRTHGEEVPKIGIVVGKKQGKSVFRNLHRRKMKEAVRRLLPYFDRGYMIVLGIRKEGYFANPKDIYSDLLEVASRAGILTESYDALSLTEDDW